MIFTERLVARSSETCNVICQLKLELLKPAAKENPYLFTGREVDILDNGDLKLQHNRHRVYSYTLARWLQADPMGVVPYSYMNGFNPRRQYAGGVNIYQYVGNSPMVHVDPLGLFNLKTHVNITITSLNGLRKNEFKALSDCEYAELLRGAVVGSMFPDIQMRITIPKGTPIGMLNSISAKLGYVSYEVAEFGEQLGDGIASFIGWLGWTSYPVIRRGLLNWWEDSSMFGPAVDYADSVLGEYGYNIKESDIYQTHFGSLSWQHGMTDGNLTRESIQSNLISGTNYLFMSGQYAHADSNYYEFGVSLGTALHYLQDTHTPSHTERASGGLINTFYNYSLQSPGLHGKADVAFGGSDVFDKAVSQTQTMTKKFYNNNNDFASFYQLSPEEVNLKGEEYNIRDGINPMDIFK